MKKTTAVEKLITSLVNASIITVLSMPLIFILDFNAWRWSVVGLFFLYHMTFVVTESRGCLGMRVIGTFYSEKFQTNQYILYSILYTMSFATLFWWVLFPFDVFLVNMLLIQLPTILITGTTLHGFVSGKIITVRH